MMTQSPGCFVTFQSDDPDHFVENIAQVSPSVTVDKDGRLPFHAEVRMKRFPHLGLFKGNLCNARVCNTGHDDYYGITMPLKAPLDVVTHGRSELFFPGEGHIRNCSEAFDVRVGDRLDVLVVNLDKPLFCDYLCNLEGGEISEAPCFGPRLSLLSPSGVTFCRYLNFIWSELERGGTIGDSTLIQQELENTLVAMLFHALEEQAVDTRQRDEDSSSAALRMAEDYIMAHLANPVSVADLSEVAGVSARSLFKAFQKRHGQGPMGFLKARRLEAAQRALLGADPHHTTVSQVAMDFGFFHLGQFSKDYRQAFQELPSETLRR